MSGLRRHEVVGVFYGGASPEHDVSRASAASVVRQLDPVRYTVVAIGIGRDGRWHHLQDVDVRRARDAGDRAAGGSAMADQLPVRGPEVSTEILRQPHRRLPGPAWLRR